VHAEHPPLCDARVVAVQTRAAHRDQLPVGDRFEEVRAWRVDQPDAAADELERSGIRVAPGLTRCHVHNHPHARLDQLLCRDPVEVCVVDDRDVVRPDALRQVLRAAIEPGVPGELDEAHTVSLGTLSRRSKLGNLV
jgi:hypothetical protein